MLGLSTECFLAGPVEDQNLSTSYYWELSVPPTSDPSAIVEECCFCPMWH